jgi:hypothetical protein
MQNILILTVRLINIDEVQYRENEKGISTRSGVEWTINPTTFGPMLLIIRKYWKG